MKNGQRTEPPTPVKEIAERVRRQLAVEIWEEEQRFENPHKHFMDMTPAYYRMKMQMLSCEV